MTDAWGSKIWKVSPDGALLGVIRNATFKQRPGALNNFPGLNGIVRVVKVQGSLKRGDGMELLSATRLVVAGLASRLVESSDDWETAIVTGQYVGPIHRIGSSATVKDGDVYVNHIVGFGLGKKKTHILAKAVFSPLAAAS